MLKFANSDFSILVAAHLFSPLSAENEFSTLSAENEFSTLPNNRTLLGTLEQLLGLVHIKSST